MFTFTRVMLSIERFFFFSIDDVLVHGVFVLVKGVFVLVQAVFVLVEGVFVLVQGVLGLRFWVLGLRFWVFVLETPLAPPLFGFSLNDLTMVWYVCS